jgi:hypothetical protein
MHAPIADSKNGTIIINPQNLEMIEATGQK